MASGASSFQKYRQNRPSGGGGNFTNLFTGPRGALYFKIPDGKRALVRFLVQGEELPTWCMVHKVPAPNRQYPDDVNCIDQDDDGDSIGAPCPGCEADLDRKFKGWTQLIWIDSTETDASGNLKYERPPLYAKDAEGKFIKVDKKKVVQGYASQVAVWSSGSQLFETLAEKDEAFKGLASRIAVVKRYKGANGFVAYDIEPADMDAGQQPLSDEENRIAEQAYDLSTFTQKPSYDDFKAKITGQPTSGSGGAPAAGGSSTPGNPFMRNRPGA